MTFKPDFVRTFTGGRFSFDGSYNTVADLRKAVQAMDAELAKWGDTMGLASVHLDRQNHAIDVTLKNGILTESE